MTDTKKLQSAVAYLAGQLTLGKVKLFKLLYLADFTALAELGHSISTDTYENFEMGPVPITLWRRFDEIVNDCVEMELSETGVIPEQRMKLRDGFHPKLTNDERAILDRIVTRFGRWSGNRLRDYTHKTLPYRATQRGDTIPYGLAAYLKYTKPTRADLDRLLQDATLMKNLQHAINDVA